MKPANKSFIQIHTAVFLFGLAGLFGKLILLPSVVIVFGRVFFAAVFLIILFAIRKQNIKLDKRKDYYILIFSGVILAFHWVTFFYSIQISTVATGLLTFSTFPVFVAFLEPWFFREKVRVPDLVIALVAFSGVALVIRGYDFSNNITEGAIWGVLSGLTFAIISVLNRKYVKRYSGLVIAFYQDIVAAIVLLPFLFVFNPVITVKDMLLLVLLGVVFTAIAHSLFINSMKKIKARTASIIVCLEPVYGIIAAILLLDEIPDIRVIAGGAVILFTTFYVSLSKTGYL